MNSNESLDDGPVTVLEYFLMRSGMDKKDIVSVVCDTLLAGSDTVSIEWTTFITCWLNVKGDFYLMLMWNFLIFNADVEFSNV